MRRLAIPEPCLCGATDCKECYPLSYRDNDNQPDDECDNSDADLDNLPDVKL